jgi:hypothetical protein
VTLMSFPLPVQKYLNSTLKTCKKKKKKETVNYLELVDLLVEGRLNEYIVYWAQRRTW